MKKKTILRSLKILLLVITSFLLIALFIFALWLFMPSFMPDENYVAVDFEKGEVVFYQFHKTFNSRPPFHTLSFEVYYELDAMWRTESYTDSRKHPKCDALQESTAVSKIVYGRTPFCQEEIIPAGTLKTNMKYGVLHSINLDSENVFFMLVDCEKNKNQFCLDMEMPDSHDVTKSGDFTLMGCKKNKHKTCLITNSPATNKTKKSHDKIMRRYKKIS